MKKRYITPIERNKRIISAVRLALVGFEDLDIGEHLQAVDLLMDIGEHELADGLVRRWNLRMTTVEEKEYAKDSAYREAINV